MVVVAGNPADYELQGTDQLSHGLEHCASQGAELLLRNPTVCSHTTPAPLSFQLPTTDCAGTGGGTDSNSGEPQESFRA